LLRLVLTSNSDLGQAVGCRERRRNGRRVVTEPANGKKAAWAYCRASHLAGTIHARLVGKAEGLPTGAVAEGKASSLISRAE